jgi:uncharacterized membrane protein YsdA (DUF1294 family)
VVQGAKDKLLPALLAITDLEHFMKIICLYVILINCIAFALMGIDKSRARRGSWRISEKTLFLSALLGGSPGAWLGMYVFRHKTRHWYFVIGMPLIFALQIVGSVVLCCFK